ncbi:MAG: apolipoprotein N-acyltransferase [Spirochaetales bacterium]|nr:apolipoprotein N-acyltransferase [Spirochaetales bacterium]
MFSLFKNTGIEICLLFISALLFAISFPSFLSKDGLLFPLAFIAIFPVFIVVHRTGWIRVFFYGALYGFICYVLYNYWLAKFHPLALIVVPVIYAAYFFFFFPVLKLIDWLFPRYGYILQAVAWIAYEYLRTQGYLGYAYGILGYSQYLFLPLARFAALTGIWGVTLIVIFPSTFIGNCLKDGVKSGFEGISFYMKKHLPAITVYAIVFILVLIYGFVDVVSLKGVKTWRAALIQQNSDPWKNDYVEYENALDSLIALSNKSLSENPEIVIWSETAFVPAIYYHNRYREYREALPVVLKLLDFLKQQKIPYIVGNDDGRKSKIGTPYETRIDYNASILFLDGEIKQIYRKVHLVPFSEHFPYKKILPWMHKLLVETDTHFWEKGTEYTVFEVDGIKFSTPICFEDTFGYLCRRFVRKGADVLVNMTNDTWSGSVVSEIQHMSMAVFRAIENKRSLVRSTNSGITCLITPDGEIVKRLDPFVEDYLIVDIPLISERTTLYTLWEDWFGIGSLFLAAAGILFGIIKKTLKEKFK